MHDFDASLTLSQSYADAPLWLDLYRQAFPTLISAVSVRDDGWAQRVGIDRVLTLACGRNYAVDEKVRARDWPDVLLEEWSDEARHPPGWVQKPLACDLHNLRLRLPPGGAISCRSSGRGGCMEGNGSARLASGALAMPGGSARACPYRSRF
ncbi:MAG: hypothetical protein Q8R44_05530 [Novosphingobium sp.]|nr:hypothetical protein [Novosphingobium sp.]